MSNQQPLSNPSPKQRFQSVAKNIHDHRTMVDSEAFIRGTEAALIQYQAQLTFGIDSRESAEATGYKMQGALDYLLVLRMLSETPKLAAISPVGTLNEKA